MKFFFHRFYSFAVFSYTLLVLSGCLFQSPSPKQASPPLLPKHWINKHLDTPVSAIWLPEENRELIKQLIEESLQHNSQLQAQAARVGAALQSSIIAGSDQALEISSFFKGGRQRSSSGNTTDSLSLGLDFSWELDLLGKLDDHEQAALLDAAVSIETFRDKRLQLIADISGQWFTLLEHYQQLDLIQKRENNLGEIVKIIEEGYQLGLNTSLDLHLARADYSAIKAKVEARKKTLRTATRKMEYLLGRYPKTELLAAGTLPQKMNAIPAGLPADILNRRPDILAAAHSLAAANLRVAEAYKNRFPSLSLTGKYGTSTDELNQLLSVDSVIWSLFAGVVSPLINGGKLQATQERNMALAEVEAALYTDTVLTAFREVEDSLETEQRLATQQTLLEEAAKDSAQAYKLAFEKYQNGLVDYITVLESERRAFDSQSSVLTIYNERIQNRITLFLALGGDFPASEKELSFPQLP